MALVQKIDPVGVDVFIDTIQKNIFNHLTTTAGWTNYESFHRAYKNPSQGNVIPEIYTKDGEYVEVLLNDEFIVTSFFLTDDQKPIGDEIIEQDVSIIFQADIVKLFPSIEHRADEEFAQDIYIALKDHSFVSFKIKEIITGIKNVYNSINIGALENSVNWDDISNLHVLKITFTIRYFYDEDCDVTIA